MDAPLRQCEDSAPPAPKPPPALELPSPGERIPRHRSRGEELAPPAIEAVASQGVASRGGAG